MSKGFVAGISLLFLLWAAAASAAYHHMGDTDSDVFLSVWPGKAGAKVDSCALCHTGGKYEKKPGQWVSMGSCQWCHHSYGYDESGDIAQTLNAYGRDYLAKGRSASAISAIAELDSDGDGYTNKSEIEAGTYPGNAEDNPSQKTAPFKVYTRQQLDSLPQHTQFMLMNTSKSGDFYAQYSGVTVENLLLDAGIMGTATGITVFAPDGWAQYHPLEYDETPEMYPVFWTYPEAVYQYTEQADAGISPDTGWCDYSASSCAGRTAGESISVKNGLKMILAGKREGNNLNTGYLTEDNKLDGEGPYRVVVPQKSPNPPDQASNSANQDVIWPYNEDWDHNAGSCTRSVTMIRVEPLPEGTTDIDLLEAGWNYIDQEKIIVYGAIAGQDTAAEALPYEEIQQIDTNEARSWESFTIDGTAYLAAANQGGNSVIYQWNGKSFAEIQSVETRWAERWESFVISGSTYLALALNRKDESTRLADSPIYKWNGKKFELYQTLPTQGAREFESFVISGTTYLAVANERNDSSRNVDSVIYKWNGSKFAEFQSVLTHSARDWESFVIDGQTFLAIANQDNDETRDIYSVIYQWNGTEFVSFQSVLTHSARGWESFVIDGQTFLAVANNQSATSRVTASDIYRWDGTSFAKFQSLLTYGAHDCESFTVGDQTFLAVANNKDDETPTRNSVIYKWNGSAFAENQVITTYGIRDWESFEADGNVYLVAANDDEEYSENIFSRIYRIGEKAETEDTDSGGGSSCFLSTLLGK